MRIAIPVAGETVASPLGDAEGFRFYEDDHGRIVRQFLVPMEERSTKAAIDLLERYGIDALLCGTIDENERIAVGTAGLMLFPGYVGEADEAALRFLSGSIVSDPNNHCNACGFKGACSLKDKGGCGKYRSKRSKPKGLLLFYACCYDAGRVVTR